MRTTWTGRKLHWWQDDSGWMREWLWILTIILIIAAVVAGIGWLCEHFLSHSCVAPYHLVYTGWHFQLVGKVLMRVDDYACVSN